MSKLDLNDNNFIKEVQNSQDTNTVTFNLLQLFVDLADGILERNPFIHFSDSESLKTSMMFELLDRWQFFDTDVNQSPFQYFVQVAWGAGLTHIAREQKKNKDVDPCPSVDNNIN